METKMRFERSDVHPFNTDWWAVAIELHGKPEIVEEIKGVVRKHMKDRGNCQEY